MVDKTKILNYINGDFKDYIGGEFLPFLRQVLSLLSTHNSLNKRNLEVYLDTLSKLEDVVDFFSDNLADIKTYLDDQKFGLFKEFLDKIDSIIQDKSSIDEYSFLKRFFLKQTHVEKDEIDELIFASANYVNDRFDAIGLTETKEEIEKNFEDIESYPEQLEDLVNELKGLENSLGKGNIKQIRKDGAELKEGFEKQLKSSKEDIKDLNKKLKDFKDTIDQYPEADVDSYLKFFKEISEKISKLIKEINSKKEDYKEILEEIRDKIDDILKKEKEIIHDLKLSKNKIENVYFKSLEKIEKRIEKFKDKVDKIADKKSDKTSELETNVIRITKLKENYFKSLEDRENSVKNINDKLEEFKEKLEEAKNKGIADTDIKEYSNFYKEKEDELDKIKSGFSKLSDKYFDDKINQIEEKIEKLETKEKHEPEKKEILDKLNFYEEKIENLFEKLDNLIKAIEDAKTAPNVFLKNLNQKSIIDLDAKRFFIEKSKKDYFDSIEKRKDLIDKIDKKLEEFKEKLEEAEGISDKNIKEYSNFYKEKEDELDKIESKFSELSEDYFDDKIEQIKNKIELLRNLKQNDIPALESKINKFLSSSEKVEIKNLELSPNYENFSSNDKIDLMSEFNIDVTLEKIANFLEHLITSDLRGGLKETPADNLSEIIANYGKQIEIYKKAEEIAEIIKDSELIKNNKKSELEEKIGKKISEIKDIKNNLIEKEEKDEKLNEKVEQKIRELKKEKDDVNQLYIEIDKLGKKLGKIKKEADEIHNREISETEDKKSALADKKEDIQNKKKEFEDIIQEIRSNLEKIENKKSLFFDNIDEAKDKFDDLADLESLSEKIAEIKKSIDTLSNADIFDDKLNEIKGEINYLNLVTLFDETKNIENKLKEIKKEAQNIYDKDKIGLEDKKEAINQKKDNFEKSIKKFKEKIQKIEAKKEQFLEEINDAKEKTKDQDKIDKLKDFETLLESTEELKDKLDIETNFDELLENLQKRIEKIEDLKQIDNTEYEEIRDANCVCLVSNRRYQIPELKNLIEKISEKTKPISYDEFKNMAKSTFPRNNPHNLKFFSHVLYLIYDRSRSDYYEHPEVSKIESWLQSIDDPYVLRSVIDFIKISEKEIEIESNGEKTEIKIKLTNRQDYAFEEIPTVFKQVLEKLSGNITNYSFTGRKNEDYENRANELEEKLDEIWHRFNQSALSKLLNKFDVSFAKIIFNSADFSTWGDISTELTSDQRNSLPYQDNVEGETLSILKEVTNEILEEAEEDKGMIRICDIRNNEFNQFIIEKNEEKDSIEIRKMSEEEVEDFRAQFRDYLDKSDVHLITREMCLDHYDLPEEVEV